jgi:hypothetical protein
MDGHLYQQVAGQAARERNSETLHDFLKASELERYEELQTFQDWNGTLNHLVAWLFQCPDGRCKLGIVYDPFELWDAASLLRQRAEAR